MVVPVWLKDTLERSFWTFSAAFVGAAGVDGVGDSIQDIDWGNSLSIAAVATLFTLIKSPIVAKAPIGQPGTASAVHLDPAVPPATGRHAKRDEV